MPLINPWLTPFQRSYNAIKSTLIGRLQERNPEITNLSNNNIFIIILSLFAAIAEVLHYYIDNMARETFFITARKYSSLVAHSKMFDYHIKSANPSSVDLVLSLSTGVQLSGTITIPAGTVFTSRSGISFISTKSVYWRDTFGVKVPLIQWESEEDVEFGLITSEDIYLTLGELGSGRMYAEGTMVLNITNNSTTESWQLVDTFAYSKPTSRHFKVEVSSDQEPYIIFGDGVNGKKPEIGSTVTGSFKVTLGTSGNIPEGDLVTVPSSILTQNNSVICTNPERSTGGSDYEDFDMLKRRVPLSLKTLGAAITKEDYEDITRTIPGVDKVMVKNECGKYIDIYITPEGGGIASGVLLDKVKLELMKHKLLGTTFVVHPTTEAYIILAAEVTGRSSFKAIDIEDQVIGALMSAYSYNTSDISKPVRLSDIYAIIDNQSMVDYVTLTRFYLKPTPVKIGATVQNLNYDIGLTLINQPIDYYIRYDTSDTSFRLLNMTGAELGVVLLANGSWVHISIGGNSWTLKIFPPVSGTYSNGDIWKISLQPINSDQLPLDLTIPIFKTRAQISLTVNETA
jgi:uncharacterized phage protein gp47/JayE